VPRADLSTSWTGSAASCSSGRKTSKLWFSRACPLSRSRVQKKRNHALQATVLPREPALVHTVDTAVHLRQDTAVYRPRANFPGFHFDGRNHHIRFRHARRDPYRSVIFRHSKQRILCPQLDLIAPKSGRERADGPWHSYRLSLFRPPLLRSGHKPFASIKRLDTPLIRSFHPEHWVRR
jgi:hypothetical protein